MMAILGTLGVQELLVIFLILVLLFGASKLPQIGRGIGEGIRNFKTGIKESEPSKPSADDPNSKTG